MAQPPRGAETPGGRGPVDVTAELAGLWSARAGAAAPQETVADATPGGGPRRQLSFHGAGGSLFGIHLVNLLLTLVTLGVYYFWGKTKVRRYLWSQTEFDGDRFAYHGTGKELLIGALKAILVFGVPSVLLNVVPALGWGVAAKVGAGVAAYALFLVFFPLAIVGARRYRLSRTSWRGIRFSFRGRAADFIKLFTGGALLSLVTLGLYYPYFVARRHAFLVSHAYYGNERFGFDGRGRDLFRIYAWVLLLSLPTLGLYWFWFQARKQRYLWDHTSVGTARFHSTVTGRDLFVLTLVNVLLLIPTLGLAAPWVIVRNARFACRYLTLEGAVDLARIQQEAQLASATGEALAGFLDTGLGLDF
ncbi:MAG: DUF898 domain-containing protein [Candidatus Rokubacteria bacterium]|nr:DUF898 domain-containing protein [Candidatus Rokubacteria bacterium]